ncbi:tachykinin-like peptides receptor 99D [Pollicipes pollicipes]|uniref:tachykinin-like peptides receptor 99D n=1 Tax=Pollicipes pollicipes TaxID=41117 RepID=UPI001885043E|nr:tachykinin-like peptides receptor 99D [Pollicipes pollicipes]
MIVLVVIFAVCWLPYQVYFLVIPAFPELTQQPIVQEASQTFTFIYEDNSIRTLCYFKWPDGETMDSTLELVYNVTIFVLTYFLPLAATAYCYTRMSVELWGSQSIGEATPVQVESVNSKRRVVKMMIVLVVIFAVCWLPYQVYFLVIPAFPELTQQPIVQEVFLGIYWLAMSNSMYNPLIYYWMNSRFRLGFQRVFRCAGRIPPGDGGVRYRHRTHNHTTRVTLADLSNKSSANGSTPRTGAGLNGEGNHV